jgi:molybdate transport system permease protein
MTAMEWSAIGLTVRVALVSTLITLPLATALGWLLARKPMPAKPLLEALVSFPLVAPPVITGYVLLVLLGKNGLIGHWLYHTLGLKLTLNFAALILASVVVSLPLAVRAMRSAFELVDPVYEKVSRTLGAPPHHTFIRVSLPMAWPGLISAAVLSFARSLGEFGATITLAGNIPGQTQTMALMVYANMQVPGMEMAVSRLVAVSLLLSFGAIMASEWTAKKGAYLKHGSAT